MPITVRLSLEAPYSYVEATYDAVAEVNDVELWDLVERLNDVAPRPEEGAFSDGTPLPPEDSAPQNDADRAPNERHRPAQTQHRQDKGRAGTGLFCPDHKVEVFKTAPQYDKDGDRYYHPLPESEWTRLPDGRMAKNHNLYARQLTTADATPY